MALSLPVDDIRISLLKFVLAIQPKDHPIVAGALNHAWLEDFMGDNEDSRDNGNKKAQNQDESTLGMKGNNRLPAYSRSKK